MAQVLQYIEENLEKPLALAEVAQVSHFSPFHFHRIFRGIMDETVHDYIGRRRLERGANMLAFNTEMSITDIALMSGFSSSANFAKAVKQYFGYTPSQIRDPSKIKEHSKIGKVFSKYGKDFNPMALYPYHITQYKRENFILQEIDAQIEIREITTQSVVMLTSAQGYELASIFETWDKLTNWAVGHGIDEIARKRFAFCYDNPVVTPLDKCRYEAAIVIGENVEPKAPFISGQIPAGMYAVLQFNGRSEDTNQAQLGLYTSWLPDSGFEPDQFPLMERYLNDVRQDGFVLMEIMIKLRPLSP